MATKYEGVDTTERASAEEAAKEGGWSSDADTPKAGEALASEGSTRDAEEEGEELMGGRKGVFDEL